MGTELPTRVMLGQTLVLMQMTFLNNVRKVGRLVLSRTSCFCTDQTFQCQNTLYTVLFYHNGQLIFVFAVQMELGGDISVILLLFRGFSYAFIAFSFSS
jgi:hypothetical protein